MSERTVSGTVLIMFSVGLLMGAFHIQPVRASGTISIRADGNVEGTDDIVTVDNVTYTFIDNVSDSIVVERDNIVIDGAGYTLQGMGSGTGIDLSGITSVTVRNIQIENFYYGIGLSWSSANSIVKNSMANNIIGIQLWESSYNAISRNNITNNGYGIKFMGSTYNSIAENNITANNGYGIWLVRSFHNAISGSIIANNSHGIRLEDSSMYNSINGNILKANNYFGVSLEYYSFGNKFYHNDFIRNTEQISGYSINAWDDGYPSGGNYWSEYSGSDANGDGIGDIPYVIDADNQDHYPLIHPWSSLPVHNINTGLGYATIQEAIDADETLDGHTIFVEAGTYHENVILNKSISLIGENKNKTIIDGVQKGCVISVIADNVTIADFTIANSGLGSEDSGIRLYGINGCNVTQNNIISNNIGVFLEGACNSGISSNNIAENSWCGIYLSYSSDNNAISLNNLEANNWYGIGLLWSSDINDINGNSITRNYYGIGLGDGSSYNTISNNNVANNSIGIGLRDNSQSNLISGNSIETNNQYGVYFYDASYNTFYHNDFVGNSLEVYDASYMLPGAPPSTNIWDGGYPSGGNYWSGYAGTDLYSGPYQKETGSDGIGDTPYVIDERNRDQYPLMYPYSAPQPPTYPLTITATAGGTTDPALGTYSYAANSAVQVTAIPDSGYTFDRWELDTVTISVYVGMFFDPNYTGGALVTTTVPGGPADKAGLEAGDVIKQVDSLQVKRAEDLMVYLERYKNPGDTVVLNFNRNNLIMQITLTLERAPVGSPNPCTVLMDTNHTLKAFFSRHLSGDINYDGRVDMGDVMVAVDAFGSHPTHLRWNNLADINGDGRVDMTDIITMLMNFGKHNP